MRESRKDKIFRGQMTYAMISPRLDHLCYDIENSQVDSWGREGVKNAKTFRARWQNIFVSSTTVANMDSIIRNRLSNQISEVGSL